MSRSRRTTTTTMRRTRSRRRMTTRATFDIDLAGVSSSTMVETPHSVHNNQQCLGGGGQRRRRREGQERRGAGGRRQRRGQRPTMISPASPRRRWSRLLLAYTTINKCCGYEEILMEGGWEEGNKENKDRRLWSGCSEASATTWSDSRRYLMRFLAKCSFIRC